MLLQYWSSLVSTVLFHFFTWPWDYQEYQHHIEHLRRQKVLPAWVAFILSVHKRWLFVVLSLSAVGIWFFMADVAYSVTGSLYSVSTFYDYIIGFHFGAILFFGCSVYHFVFWFHSKWYRIVALGLLIGGVIGLEATSFVFLLCELVNHKAEIALVTQVMSVLGSAMFLFYLLTVCTVWIFFVGGSVNVKISRHWEVLRLIQKSVEEEYRKKVQELRQKN